MIRMLVAVNTLESFWRHSEEACGFPERDTALHEPGGAGMPQNMGRHITEVDLGTSRREAALDVLQPLAVLMHDKAQIGAAPARTSQVTEQPARNRNARPTLIGSACARRIEVDPPYCEVHLRPAQRQNRLFALAGIYSNQYE